MRSITKLSSLFLLLLSMPLVYGSCANDFATYSHTFFRPASLSQNSMLELALHNYDYYHQSYLEDGHCCRNFVNLQVTAPFYFRSTNTKSLAQYFLPQCKDHLDILSNNLGDINPRWLCYMVDPMPNTGVPFESTVTIRPRRDVIGGAFKLWLDFGALSDCAWYRNFWASVYVPVVHVRHDLNFEENLIRAGTFINCPKNAEEAFNNPRFQYGKLSTETLKKTGVDDIEFKFGWDITRNDDNHASAYFTVFAPTGRKSNARYLFEPTFGSGGHVGVGGGLNFEYLFADEGAHKVSVISDLRLAFFLKGTETRSFDLRNGEWSRYLIVFQNPNNNGPVFPGINYFTQKVDVTPGATAYWWITLHYNYCCCWDFEGGYSLWWRQHENLCLKKFTGNLANTQVGIFDVMEPCPVRTSASNAEISNTNYVSDPRPFVLETIRDINSRSARQPDAHSSTFYVAGSRIINWCDTQSMIGAGFSYEFAHRKSALSQWGLWLKTSIGF